MAFKIKKSRNKQDTPQAKSQAQEKKSARELGGRVTLNSGALPFDKSDIYIQKSKIQFDPKTYRIECKRTDNNSIAIKKSWIDKLICETQPKEFWALELEIQDQQVVVIPKHDFQFLAWVLTTPKEEVIKILGGGGG